MFAPPKLWCHGVKLCFQALVMVLYSIENPFSNLVLKKKKIPNMIDSKSFPCYFILFVTIILNSYRYPFEWVCHILIFISVQLLSRVRLFATPWTEACQASLSITNSQSLLKLMSIELVMPSNYLILCHPLLLPSIFPSIRVFFSESVLHIRWPKCWSFSFSISPSNEALGFISFKND